MTTSIIKFIDTFFEDRSRKKARKEFKRFRDVMPDGMEPQEIEAMYKAFSGKPAFYGKECFYSPEELADAKSIVLDMLQYIDGEPTSFADIYIKYLEKRGFNIRFMNALPRIPYEPMLRRCFKELATNNLIRCIEVKTCGKVAIRLYWV